MRVTHYGSILQAFGDTKGILYLSINLVVANILLSIPFTIWFGIVGTATATFLANMYNWVITLQRIGGHMELPAHKVLPFPFYLKVLGTSLLVAAPVWLFRFSFIAEERIIVGLITAMVLFLISFAVIGTLFRVITPDDWKKFRDWVSMKFLTIKN